MRGRAISRIPKHGPLHSIGLAIGFCLCFSACEFPLPSVTLPPPSTPPRIDGILNDRCWLESVHIPQFILTDGTGVPSEATEVLISGDSTHLFLGFICSESRMDSVRVIQAKSDGRIFAQDRVEVFVDVEGEGRTYYHLALAASGATFDGLGAGSADTWNGLWKSSVALGDSSWTAEISLQVGSMLVNGSPRRDRWNINFARYEARKHERSAWSPTLLPSFHVPARFGRLERPAFDFDRFALRIGTALPGKPFFGGNQVTVSIADRAGLDRELAVTMSSTDRAGRETRQVSRAGVKGLHEAEVAFTVPSEVEGEEELVVEVADLRLMDPIYRSPVLRFVVPPPLDLQTDRSYYSEETFATCRLSVNMHPGRLDAESGRLRVLDSTGRILSETRVVDEVRLPVRSLPDGTYRLVGAMSAMDGAAQFRTERELVIRRGVGHREIKVDGMTGALLAGGVPFFPVGIYWARTEHLDQLAADGFNLGDYYPWLPEPSVNALMDSAASRGIGILFEFSDLLRPVGMIDAGLLRQRVERYRTHPALLAWYLIDEPGETRTSSDETRAAYSLIKEADPTHPVYLVNNRPDTYADYAGSCDILTIDPYPIPNRPPSAVADAVDAARAAVRDRKPIWVVIQAFGATEAWARPPTPAEERSMVYLSIIHGAKGILFYRHCSAEERRIQPAELWEAVCQLVSELRILGPVLLSGEEVAGGLIRLEGPDVDMLANRYGDDVYVLLANRSGESRDIRVVLYDGQYTGGEAFLGAVGGARIGPDGLTDRLEGYGTRAYRLRKVGM